jgi:MFS family permease
MPERPRLPNCMASQLSGRNRRDFWVLTSAQGLNYCGFFAFFQFPLFIKSLGGDELHIGLMMGASAFAATLLIPWIAEYVTRADRRRIMLAGTAATLLTSIACLGLTAPNWAMLALLIARGFSFAVYSNASGAYLAEILPAAERSRWLGINFGFNQIAIALGPALAEFSIRRFGFPALFLTAGGFLALGNLLLLIVSVRPGTLRGTPSDFLRVGAVFLRELGTRPFRYLYLTLLMMACGLGAVFTFTATYVTGLGLSSGLFFLLYALINASSRIGGGSLSDRYGRAVIILPTLSLFAVGILLYSFTHGLAMLVVSALTIGLGFGMSNPVILAQLLDRAVPGRQGRVIGGFNFCYQLGSLCATPLFGVAAQNLGYPPMWWLACATIVAATLIYALTEGRGALSLHPRRTAEGEGET